MSSHTSELGAVLSGISKAALDIIYPVHCVLCGEFGKTYLCESCAVNIPEQIADPICARCGHHASSSPCEDCLSDPPKFTTRVCAGEYSGNLQEAIHWLKYRDRPMLSEPLGRILLAAALQNRSRLNDLKFDLVIPVPMHALRQRVRGYNHAERLAQAFGEGINVKVAPKALKRKRLTKAQVGMAGEARRKNLDGAFIASQVVGNQTILLVDDVSTTGSTLRECAKALMDAGAKSVFCITLAAG
jgi:competence protein ComFC